MKILAFTENDEKRDEFFNKLMAVEDDLKKLKELDDEITKNKKDSTFYKYRPQIIFLVLFLWVFTNKEKLVPLLEKTGTISSSSCVASIDAPFTKLKEWWVKNKYEEEFLNNSINDLKGKAEDFWKNEENQLTVKYNEIIGHNKS